MKGLLCCAALVLLVSCGERPPGQTSAIAVQSLLGGNATDDQAFARADRVVEFVFPDDHGAHPAYRSEWWYLTLALKNQQGDDLGVQFTLFRQALAAAADAADPWQNGQMYMAHAALTDVAGRVHLHDQRIARGHPDLAGSLVQPLLQNFSVWLEDWRLEGTDGAFTLNLRTADFDVQVDLEQLRPVLMQGEQGLSRKGEDQASYYYSLPRLLVSGEIKVGDKHHHVSGFGWLDREWSTSLLGRQQTGWAWFALMLENGEDVMVFRLLREDGQRSRFDHGMRADGVMQEVLHPDDFDLLPLEYWNDSDGGRWPVVWELKIGERRLLVRALLDDQVMDTLVMYWEGLVEVIEDGRRVGQGYMELTGYN